jgi:NAD(P)-dependent dehydrogenase (short-subunit alcohol dehydrogenase family)
MTRPGTIVVTGAASGLGAGCARHLAREGRHVTIADIDATRGQTIARELGDRASFAALDVRDEARWQAVLDEAIARHGRIAGLVNAAGVAHDDDSLDRCARAVWDYVMGVNLDGVFLGCKHAIRRMTEGAIVNIASINAQVGDASAIAYCTSKGAVWQLSRSAALHCARSGSAVRVNSVHPGYVRTAMTEPFLAADPALEREWLARTPMGRLGAPGDIAPLIAYLLSDDAQFVNGASLAADGGLLAY